MLCSNIRDIDVIILKRKSQLSPKTIYSLKLSISIKNIKIIVNDKRYSYLLKIEK